MAHCHHSSTAVCRCAGPEHQGSHSFWKEHVRERLARLAQLEKMVPWWTLAEQRAGGCWRSAEEMAVEEGAVEEPQSVTVPHETVGRAMGEQRS